MIYQSNQLRDYSSLFSRREVLHWLKMDFNPINCKIVRYDKDWIKSNKSTYLDYLKYVYSILTDNYQNEYVFKNEFISKWLISELGVSDSKIFSEFRLGNSIADLAMFNGCSKIFEIKTELDSEVRLDSQLANYSKAFNEVYLIVPKSRVLNYCKYDTKIGLIEYDPLSENHFNVIRSADTNYEIDPPSIMSILHSKEYKSIVKNFYGFLPAMTSFSQYSICYELIMKIPRIELNRLFIAEIKKRGVTSALSSRYYKEFNQLFLALKMDRVAKHNMINILKTPIQL